MSAAERLGDLYLTASGRIGRRAFADEEIMERILGVMQAEGRAIVAEGIAASPEAVAAIDTLVDDFATRCALTERFVLATLEAGCTAPVAASAALDGDEITVRGGVFALDGSAQLVREASGTDPREVGQACAQQLFDAGAAQFL